MNAASGGNSPYHAGIRIPPPAIYAGVFGIGFFLERLFPLMALPSGFSKGLSLICAGISAILGLWSFAWFLRKRTSLLPFKPSTVLVTSGPYRFTRNPMYLSLLFVYMGCAFWFDVFWAIVLAPVVIAIVRYYVIAGEERYLEHAFGRDYLEYKKRVRRWI